jgi:glutaredoxin
MALRLHRCSATWLKIGPHPCWAVQKALDEEGVDYDVVKGPLRKSRRDEIGRLSGQRLYPVIEFEDGRVLREESKEMEERIRSGRLLEDPPAGPTA